MKELAKGRKYFSKDGDSYVDWVWLEMTDFEAYLINTADNCGEWNHNLTRGEEDLLFYITAEYCMVAHNSGVGQPFKHAPTIKIANRKVLVRQHGGWDV